MVFIPLIPPTELEKGAKLLYGPQWKKPLAELLGISPKTLSRRLDEWKRNGLTPRSVSSKLELELAYHCHKIKMYLAERGVRTR